MKKQRFTEEQIIGVLKEQEAGAKATDLCRKHGISEATFYNWKAKYGGHGSVGGQASEGAGGRERQAEEAARRTDAGYSRTPRASLKKVVGPAAMPAAPLRNGPPITTISGRTHRSDTRPRRTMPG